MPSKPNPRNQSFLSLKELPAKEILAEREMITMKNGFSYIRLKTKPHIPRNDLVLQQCEKILVDYVKVDSLEQTYENIKRSNSDLVKLAQMIFVAVDRSKVVQSPLYQDINNSSGVPGMMYLAKKYLGKGYNCWDLNKEANKKYLGVSMPLRIAQTLFNNYGNVVQMTFIDAVEETGEEQDAVGGESYILKTRHTYREAQVNLPPLSTEFINITRSTVVGNGTIVRDQVTMNLII